MMHSESRLESLLTLRQSRREICRVKLAAACGRERQLADNKRALETELAVESARVRDHAAPGPIAVGLLRDAARYEAALRAKIAAINENRRAAVAEVERWQHQLAAAEREVGVVEKLHKRHSDQRARRQAQLDQRQLNELTAQRRA